jgi:positive regulator of sigma E activity
MIEEKAVVVGADDQWLQVRLSGEKACEACDLAEQCYRDGGLLKLDLKRVRGPAGLKPGSTIMVTMEHASLLSLTGVVYGIPLLLFALGLAAGYYLLLPEVGEAGRALGSFAAGIGLVAAAWIPICRLDRRMARQVRYRIDLPEDTDGSSGNYYAREYSSED